MKKKQNNKQKQNNETQERISKNLFAIEEACHVLNETYGIYSTDLADTINEFYRQLEDDDERKACRVWVGQLGFDLPVDGDKNV